MRKAPALAHLAPGTGANLISLAATFWQAPPSNGVRTYQVQIEGDELKDIADRFKRRDESSSFKTDSRRCATDGAPFGRRQAPAVR